MAALLHDARRGAFRPDGPVVFVHTGGVPALFHYRDQLGLPAVLRAAAQTPVA
jgi:1-aminocyclopropane-1-carboxylate deaminase/D-cysteine desulfhydrase-like pyridoxal-dependent ACC family enzyme